MAKGNKRIYPHKHKLRNGYRELWCPEHPRNRDGYVYEHTLVMESVIGRYLNKGEVVHHLDENRSNNEIGNLVLLSSKGDHARIHKLLNLNRVFVLKESENGSFICVKQRLEHVPCKKCGKICSSINTGLCRSCYLETGLQLTKTNLPSYEVLEEEHRNGVSYQVLADRYGTSYQTIRSRIRKRIVI